MEDNGASAQVDGSFPVEPLVRAVISAIREPSEAMSLAMARAMENRMPCDSGEDPPQAEVMVECGVPQAAIVAMIDALLEEGR